MNFNIREFYYPFSWKKPFIYIVLCVSVCIYILIFFIHCEKETFGVINMSRELLISIFLIFTTFLFHFFRNSQFIQKVESIFLRSLLLFCVCFSVLLLAMPARIFREYDNQKMDTYWRILPFKDVPRIRIKETLVFNTIKTVKYIPGVDTVGTLTFYLNNGKPYGMTIANISGKTLDIFLVTLSQECDWLKSDIEERFGLIEAIKQRIETNKYNDFNIIHGIFYIILIWLLLTQVICLIVFNFKIKFKYLV